LGPPTPLSGSPPVPLLSPPPCFACSLVAAGPGPACTFPSSFHPSCVTPAPRCCCRWRSPGCLQDAPHSVPGTALHGISATISTRGLPGGYGSAQDRRKFPVWITGAARKTATPEPVRDASACPRPDPIVSILRPPLHISICAGAAPFCVVVPCSANLLRLRSRSSNPVLQDTPAKSSEPECCSAP